MSEANEDKTSDDFRQMGLRLAQEVVAFVKKKMDKVSRSGRLGDIKLSFVGHSIGNVILRTALAGRIIALDAMLCFQFLVGSRSWHFFFFFFCREHYGAIPKIPIYICFYIWSTLGVSL
jgi:hypothetical protein